MASILQITVTPFEGRDEPGDSVSVPIKSRRHACFLIGVFRELLEQSSEVDLAIGHSDGVSLHCTFQASKESPIAVTDEMARAGFDVLYNRDVPGSREDLTEAISSAYKAMATIANRN